MNPLNKQDVANHLLGKGTVCIHLDPRAEGVQCPPWLKDQPQVALQFGWNLPVPIPDLRIDEDGIFGTLSFRRCAYECFCPWDAIFIIVGDEGRGQVWPESMPPELAAEVAKEAAAKSGSEPTAAAAPSTSPEAASTRPKTRRRSLPAGWRVVK